MCILFYLFTTIYLLKVVGSATKVNKVKTSYINKAIKLDKKNNLIKM